MGTLCSRSPLTEAGAMRVTLGSQPRKAERRNLKPPILTSRSVQMRIADFCSLRASRRPAEVRHSDQRPWRRPFKAAEAMVTTMSTSGTATPKAVRPKIFPLTKPATCASGTAGRMSRRTFSTIFATRASPSGVGAMRWRSSSTSASQPTAWKVGADTGATLGLRTSGCRAATVVSLFCLTRCGPLRASLDEPWRTGARQWSGPLPVPEGAETKARPLDALSEGRSTLGCMVCKSR
mmetsp:Transcript_42706/g.91015  ORF Transcript_42706/g.91015 Transcript_42706/m.91015 type:complete len:236 (+) Transcript_42706:924-1631(+)